MEDDIFMKNKLMRKIVITGTLCATLVVPSFAQGLEMRPIRQKINHWSGMFVEQLSQQYDMGVELEEKNLNAEITLEDFQKLIKMTLDSEYSQKPDSITREAIVHEMMNIWSNKTGVKLDEVMLIKMIFYSDMGEIDTKYNEAINIAYVKNIAKGKGSGSFDPKANTTLGELVTLIYNTNKAIDNETNPGSIVKGSFETRVTYVIKDDKVVFDFELMSHYTKPQEITFGSGQSFELVITDEQGNEVYRFSDGKAFIQMLRFQEINAGEALTFQDEWDMTNKDGVKLTSGKFKAEITIKILSEEIDKSELTKVIEFSLD